MSVRKIVVPIALIAVAFCCSIHLLNCASPYMSDSMEGAPAGYAMDDSYPGTEKFGELTYNPFVLTSEDNLSTFGIDVDAGSYTFGRKKIREGHRPQKESVRIEEYINYFRQDYPVPADKPIAVYVDGALSPFRGDSLHILRIGMQGKTIDINQRKPWNLTFLIDISGSMESRLDFVKECLYLLIDTMQPGDKLSICTYAGGVGTVLLPTGIDQKEKEGIKGMIGDLAAGGSTAMASGLQNAYAVNKRGFISEGVNRVIVCSDGDANVGSTSHEKILETIRSYTDEGITLSTLGFGQGNYNDYLMEQLADRGNGNYYYIDCEQEAQRLFNEELTGLMEVIAKDVKIQVEFNKETVLRYRLIGYENRAIDDDAFEQDTTDGGEIGAGHRVTALYEIELSGTVSGPLGVVHVRYQLPDGSTDIPFDVNIERSAISTTFEAASSRFRFTAAVAEYAELLRGSPYTATPLSALSPIITESYNVNDSRDAEFLDLYRKVISLE